VTSDSNAQSVETLDGNRFAFTDRSLAGWEIASVMSSILIAEWMAATAAGFAKAIIAIPVALAILIVILSHRLRRESLRDIGFRFDNLLKALSILAVPVLSTALLCLLAGWKLGTPVNFLRWHPNRHVVLQFAVGFCWALAQQYVLQGFVNRRAMIWTGRGWGSVLVVAAIFALLHLPNVWITAITFVGGFIWAAIYQRVPNLFALAITHSLMTWFIVSTLPPTALHHLRVGLGYFF
jgi:membrane protease YdiL (CAAX protease family)